MSRPKGTAARVTIRPRLLVAAIATLVIASAAGVALLPDGGAVAPTAPFASAGSLASTGSFASAGSLDQTAFATESVPATSTSTLGPTARPTVAPVDVWATPSPGPRQSGSATGEFDFSFVDARRPLTEQSPQWLDLKAAGRVDLRGGRIGLLDAGSNPLATATGASLPAARRLDISWTRWVVEPPGSGVDEKGTRYSDGNYWNLCGPGAMTVALYYWQQLAGGPNVTGTSGYYLDPYAAEGVAWPSPGPTVARSSAGTRLGTYWSGSDRVDGYRANGRGYLMYLAMAARPPGWASAGIDLFTDQRGHPLYPTRGASPRSILMALNWELSGHEPVGWADAWYTAVTNVDPTLARDLRTAVMLDVGRDGVPVIAAVDSHELPNWQAGSATPHVQHGVTIVGYDNTANPPTYTYLDTCGRGCNSRSGNQNGGIYVISQAAMVRAIQDSGGSGFIW